MSTLEKVVGADLLTEIPSFAGIYTQGSDEPSSPAVAARRLLVSLIIPTLNEAQNLPRVLSELPTNLHEILVVDGHSTDDTREIVEGFNGPTRFVTQPGVGKGDALRHGFEQATGDVIITFDADGSADPSEIPKFVRAIANGADAALGSRYLFGGSSDDMTAVREFGNIALRTITNLVHGVRFTDVTYGYNAFSSLATNQLVQLGGEFEIETVNRLMVLRAGLPWIEIPCVERRRFFGKSNLRPVQAGLRITRAIIALRLMPGSCHVRSPGRWRGR